LTFSGSRATSTRPTLVAVEDEIDSQRERFSAILREGVSAGTITLDEYDSKLGAVYSAQSIAELEFLVPWALAPRPKRSRAARACLAGGVAACLVATTVVAAMALSRPAREHLTAPEHPGLPVHPRRKPPGPARTARVTIPPSKAAVTTAPSLIPKTTALPAVVPVAPRVYGSPTGSTVAAVSVNISARQVTLIDQDGDVTYSVCASFQVVMPGGGKTGLSGLEKGAFGTVAVDSGVPCLKSVEVSPIISVPECNSSTGLPGDGDVRWEGFNPSAHSVLYRGVSYGALNATRWCGAPVVVGPDKAVIRMSQIPVGSVVNMFVNGNDWVTGINYCGLQQCYGAL
jgi:Domain of unknown function (DUF1707)